MTISPFLRCARKLPAANLEDDRLRAGNGDGCFGGIQFRFCFGLLSFSGWVSRRAAWLILRDDVFDFGCPLFAKRRLVPVLNLLGQVGVNLNLWLRVDQYRPVISLGVDHGDGHLSHADSFTVAGATEDYIHHVCAAQGFRALLTQHPGNSIQNVGLAATIGAHDDGDPGAGQRQLGTIAEAFEPQDVNFLQFKHANS